MIRSKLVTALVGMLLSVVLGGCVASRNPIGPFADAVSEPRLAGSWQFDGPADREWGYLHIFAADDGMLEVVAINSQERAWVVLSGHVTAVGDRRYVNLRILAASSELKADLARQERSDSHPYSFIAYRLDGEDRLIVVYPLAPLFAAVKDGRLAGETVGDYDVAISDSGAKIAAVLGSIADADLYAEPAAYRRMPASTSP